MFIYKKKSQKEILKNSKMEIQIEANRNGSFITINSSELVPGDIIRVPKKGLLPCDCVLLSGEVLLNESSLTGEVDPVPKFPLPNSNEIFKY
jgi:cation-transporting P-type ATPase 13A2